MRHRKSTRLLALIVCVALNHANAANDGQQHKDESPPKDVPHAGSAQLNPPCPASPPAPADAELSAAAGIERQGSRPMLYRISLSGNTSYLFGSIHLGPPLLRRPAPTVSLALVRSKLLLIEAVPSTAQQQQWQLLSTAEDHNELRHSLGPSHYQRYLDLAKRAGVTTDRASHLRPWAAMLAVGSPPNRGAGLDQSILMQARTSGLAIVGMQKLSEIAKTLNTLSVTDQLTLLRDTLCQAHKLPAYYRQLARLYVQGNPELLRIFNHWGREQDATLQRFDQFLVQRRNRIFLRKMIEPLKTGGVFVSIGAAHLAGATGLLQLLREQGFKVQPQR